MPSNYPTSPTPNGVTVTSIVPTNVTYTQSLRRVAANIGVQAFSFDVSYPPQTWANLAPLWTFLLTLAGRSTTCYFFDPRYSPQGVVTGAISADGGAAIGAVTVAATGFAVSTTGVFKAGDYVKFAGHDKVYVIRSDVNSDGSGDATLPIFPSLQYTVANAAVVYHTAATVKFLCALKSDELVMDVNEALRYGFSVSLEEVLSV